MIRLLPPDVSSKIAAGEVVERPASVVKELVENSIDAGASEVSVEVRGGGVDYISVADDASGIAADQVELAFQRFATSKVAAGAELEAIPTLGFRGEALPSIAAVAAVSMVTRSSDAEFATRVDAVDGDVARSKPQGAAPGTVVTVRDLFKSLPARRKFLRSVATETSRVEALVHHYAAAYPEIRFQMKVDGSTSFATTGSGDLTEVAAAVYGLKVAQAMLELSSDETDGEGRLFVGGLISPPTVDRANRSYISFFVNRRWVQNRILGYALTQAYHGFLKERRYPLAIVNVSLPYEDIDVNVHPAKTEVRFRYENQVFGAVQQAARRALTVHTPVPEIRRVNASHALPVKRSGNAAFWPAEPFAGALYPATPGPARPREHGLDPTPGYYEPQVPSKALPALRVLGQVQHTYIAAEGPDGMYLIDQHASHERIVFEQVRARAASRDAEVQSLLEPATVELSPQHDELLESQGELIASLGFLLEPFGDRTWLVRGVPMLLTDGNPAASLVDILDAMDEGGGFESWEERAAYSVACHGAIRAGKSLSHEEMSELARQLEQCQQPHTCPHGRPTMIHLSASQLEREFGRS